MKKAAMFGLDARIALAIFGALSVISGAALYSAIQKAKAASFMVSVQEHFKALEELYLDTGSLRVTSSEMDVYEVDDLIVDSGIVGWKGPYIGSHTESVVAGSYPRQAIRSSGIPERYDWTFFRSLKSHNWQPVTTMWSTGVRCGLATEVCSVWFQASTTDFDDKMGVMLDKIYDDGNKDTGSIMYAYNAGRHSIYIKGFTFNPL